MTANESLNLSTQVYDLLKTDLSHVFHDEVPFDLIEKQSRELIKVFVHNVIGFL